RAPGARRGRHRSRAARRPHLPLPRAALAARRGRRDRALRERLRRGRGRPHAGRPRHAGRYRLDGHPAPGDGRWLLVVCANSGISLALIAKLKGYPLTCVLPANATEERRKLLRLYGARIVDSPADEGSNGAVRLALELAEREPRYFMPFQYANEANPRAHYEGTGAEIVDALDRVD